MVPISVRYGIPLLILAFTAALASYTVQRDQSSAEAVVHGEAVSHMISRMSDLQKQFNDALESAGDRQLTQEMLFRSESESQVTLLADDMEVVLAATSREWIGSPLFDVAESQLMPSQSEPLRTVVERVRRQRGGEVHLSGAGRYVLGIYPVSLGRHSEELASDRIGVLIVRNDLAHELARARRTVRQHTVETVSMLAGLAVVLGILVHFLVTRRLGALVEVTRRFASGDLDARADLHGNDEVAALSRAFDRMAAQVADTQRQLERRVQDRTLELAQNVAELEQEIAERRRAENALFDEKERIEVTLASIGDAVITTDVNGRVNYLNPMAEKLIGCSGDEMAGCFLAEAFTVVNEASRVPVEDPVQESLREGKIVGLSSSALLIRRDGQERSIDASAAPIHDHAGATIGSVLVFRDVSEARRAARQLSYHASHDALTGLINRREFERRVERILATAGTEESHAVLYLDLDQFKVVNDTCGHAAGDELLRQISGVLALQVRKRDTLARLGGDEFGVLLEHCRQDQALRIAGQILEALQGLRFVWQERAWNIGASIGLVPMTPDLDNLASILKAADSACYVAKDQGRNRVHVYQPDDREVAQRHGEMQWVPRIQEALADDRFTLFYQPIIALGRHGAPPHGEVLLRLLSHDGDTVLPAVFIPAAERFNQMQALDRWVIRTVFAALRDVTLIPPTVCVAINISGQSLSDRQFLEFVEHQIKGGSIPLERICFEVTETAAISNLSHAMRFFSALKLHGCRFALDDFGCGLSSFSYLKTLPVDYLKIDGGFVKDMVHDPIDYAMVEAIHRIGHVMGIETIAECVESENALDLLRAIGVDYAQGYALAKPIPLGEIAHFLGPSLTHLLQKSR
jgi:diguanylate cyclase (GGDEF)-like protein/PAS domain S-box-containing protein